MFHKTKRISYFEAKLTNVIKLHLLWQYNIVFNTDNDILRNLSNSELFITGLVFQTASLQSLL